LSNFQQDLTRGSVTKQLLKFALPFLLSNLLQAMYNMADMLIVGWFSGPVGTSAVGIGGNVTILVINLISGLAVGGTVLIAQFIGAQRQEDVKKTVGTMFTMYGIAAVVLTVIMLILNPYILRLLNAPSESFEEALRYLNICILGNVFVFGYNAVSAVLRGMGNSRHPLIFVAIAAVINVILDLILVGPLGMGAAGAAWATIMAQAISFILSIIYLRRNNFLFDFHPRSFRINKDIAVQLLKIGLPTSLQGTLVSSSFMFLTRLANDIAGIAGSTALSIAGKINSVAILPSAAMQASVSSMAGQNLGAKKPERALKTMFVSMGLAFTFSSIVFAVVNLFSDQIIALFIGSGNTDLPPDIVKQCIQESRVYIRHISYDYFVVSIIFNINGLAIGAGQTLFSLLNATASSLLLRIPTAWILGIKLDWGLKGVALAAPIAGVGSAIIGIFYLLSGKWRVSSVKSIK
jgi:putative MATE family efflux protein